MLIKPWSAVRLCVNGTQMGHITDSFFLVCTLEGVKQTDDFKSNDNVLVFLQFPAIFPKLLNYSPFSSSSNPPVLHFVVFLWARNAVVVLCWILLPSLTVRCGSFKRLLVVQPDMFPERNGLPASNSPSQFLWPVLFIVFQFCIAHYERLLFLTAFTWRKYGIYGSLKQYQ